MGHLRLCSCILCFFAGPWLQAEVWSLKVEALARDGRAVPGVQVTVVRRGNAREEQVKEGDAFPAGTELVTPARTTLILLSQNGNRLTLLPSSRLRITSGSARGEEYGLEDGRLRCLVRRALSFFNVRHDTFQALVRGTEYSVAVTPHKEIRFEVEKGEVEIQREVKVLVEKEQQSRTVPMAEHLQAGETRSYRLDIDAYLVRFKHYGEAEAYYRSHLGADRASGDPERLATGLAQMGHVLLLLSQPETALPCFEEGQAILHRLHGEAPHAALAAGLLNLSAAQREFGGELRLREALRLAQEALAMNRSLYPAGLHEDIARALASAGLALRALGGQANLDRACQAFQEALDLRRRLHPEGDHEGIAEILLQLAMAQEDRGGPEHLARAIEAYRETLAMRRRLHPNGPHPDHAVALLDLGGALVQVGTPTSLEEAIAVSGEALQQYRKLFPAGTHDGIVSALNNLGAAYGRRGTAEDLTQSIHFQEEALEILRRLHPGKATEGAARALNNLGRAYALFGDEANYRRAAQRHEEALAMYRELFPAEGHEAIATILNNLGTTYNYLGALFGSREDFVRSRAFYEEALRLFRRRFPSGHPGMAPMLGSLAFDDLFLKDAEAALSAAQEALTLAPGEAWIQVVASHALILLNREEEAKAILLRNRGTRIGNNSLCEALLLDYEALHRAGVEHPGFKRMEALLKE